MKNEQLRILLNKHALWITNPEKGERADLSGANGLTFPIFQVQGSKHPLWITQGLLIKIGCSEFSAEDWEKVYQIKGEQYGYTPGQQEEYLRYILLAKDIIMNFKRQ